MHGVWEIMRRNEESESVVVGPSVSLDRVGERSGSLQQAQLHPQSEYDQSQRHRHDQSLAEPRSEVAPWPMSILFMHMTARTQAARLTASAGVTIAQAAIRSARTPVMTAFRAEFFTDREPSVTTMRMITEFED
jgi:hypothetical protein